MRKLNTKAAKPVTAAKPEAKAAKPVKPAPAPEAKAAKPAAHITRTAAAIVRNATNFGNLSDRDAAYITFYSRLAKRNGGAVTLSQIAESGERPNYAGSAKPHDAGVINRLTKAGFLSVTESGNRIAFKDKAKTHAAYAAGQR